MAKVKGFDAWIDRMPGANNKLIVQGEVEVPTTGWSGTLTEVLPSGINPTIIKLKAELTPPSGMAGDAISYLKLRFEKTDSAAIKTVTITGLGSDFDVPVKDAH